jgi:hypothetical protein
VFVQVHIIIAHGVGKVSHAQSHSSLSAPWRQGGKDKGKGKFTETEVKAMQDVD